MAMIDEPIELPVELEQLIRTKRQEPNFSYKSWSDEDLLPLRRAIRNYYKDKQHGECAYCRNPVSLESVGNCHAEHIAPKSLHPQFMFHPRNLCVICADCNVIKRAQETIEKIPETVVDPETRSQYPRSSDAFKIVHPHFDDWDAHLVRVGQKIYADKSEKGAYTILACKLNRFLHKFGWESEYAEDHEINQLMNEYLECKSGIRRAQILGRLREILFNV